MSDEIKMKFKIGDTVGMEFHLGGSVQPSPPTPTVEHYGIKITGDSISYLYDAAGKTPATVDWSTGTVSLGGWANAFFVKNNYPCMLRSDGTEAYKLDPTDQTKKEDGTASDIADMNFAGNAMSCFNCHIWMKFWEDTDGGAVIEVADSQLDSDFVDYPYINTKGERVDKMYFPMFRGAKDSSNVLRSIATNGTETAYTLTDAMTAATANGNRWGIKSWAFATWFNVLVVLLFRSLDVTHSSMYNSNFHIGYAKKKGQFCFKYLSDNNQNNINKLFFCENFWGGNRNELIAGLYIAGKLDGSDPNYFNTYDCYYKMYPPYTTDGSTSGYFYKKLYSAETEGYPDSNAGMKYSVSKNYGILPDSSVSTSRLKIVYGNMVSVSLDYRPLVMRSDRWFMNFYETTNGGCASLFYV